LEGENYFKKPSQYERRGVKDWGGILVPENTIYGVSLAEKSKM